MLIRCIDLETTGTSTETVKHSVCEVGFTDITVRPADRPEVHKPWSAIVVPTTAMDVEARAVHHITDLEALAGWMPTTAFAALMNGTGEEGHGRPDYFVAHHADGDKEYFGGGDIPMVCSWKASCRVFMDAPSQKLQVLRYYLGLDLPPALALPAHRAGPDSFVLAHVFARMLEQGTPIEDMLRWSKGAALMPRFPLGDYRGKKWDEVPDSMLEWVLDPKRSFDRDTLANCKFHLKQRALKRAQAAEAAKAAQAAQNAPQNSEAR